jgi:uridine kinase
MSDLRFELQPAYFALAASLRSLIARDLASPRARGFVIGIAGESGSGKSISATALAHELAAHGHAVSVLHQDDYFLRPPRTNHEHRLRDIDSVGPHEVRLDLLAEHVAAFRDAAIAVEGPLVDYPGNRFVTQRHDFAHRDLLVVEGTYVLQLDDLDVRIFLEATHHDTVARRRLRNRDIDDPFVERVLAVEHDIIVRQRVRADIVVDRDYVAHRTSTR